MLPYGTSSRSGEASCKRHMCLPLPRITLLISIKWKTSVVMIMLCFRLPRCLKLMPKQPPHLRQLNQPPVKSVLSLSAHLRQRQLDRQLGKLLLTSPPHMRQLNQPPVKPVLTLPAHLRQQQLDRQLEKLLLKLLAHLRQLVAG